jgi:glycosyltransferase involved in cell wall biosynthesis
MTCTSHVPRSPVTRTRVSISMMATASTCSKGHQRPASLSTVHRTAAEARQRVRVCIVYDCLYPHTIGGAERWYRELAQRLSSAGHDVTYVTLRQWPRNQPPSVPGVDVIAVGPRMKLYFHGRRRIAPPLVFGAGVLLHLLRRGRSYDVVHTCSFPYFSLLAAAAVQRLHGYQLFVDWFEVWTRDYWREYLGHLGKMGWLVQRRCVRVRHRAFCFSRLHDRRLRDEGFQGEVTRLEGLYAGPIRASQPRPADTVVVFAGRHIPEKRVTAIPPALAHAREHLPSLRAELYGDGPDRAEVLRLIGELRLNGVVETPGFVESERVHDALARCLCLILPSRREGYGLVVVEASSLGTPSVVVAEPDNAAVELVDDGENGVVVASPAPDELAAAILRIHEGGPELRERTAAWFGRNAERLSLEGSLAKVLEAYGRR